MKVLYFYCPEVWLRIDFYLKQTYTLLCLKYQLPPNLIFLSNKSLGHIGEANKEYHYEKLVIYAHKQAKSNIIRSSFITLKFMD